MGYNTSMDMSHSHEEPRIPAGEFKQRCLALLDQVAETGTSLVVTKRGQPVARIVPIEPADSLHGSVRVLTDVDEELYGVGGSWEAETPG